MKSILHIDILNDILPNLIPFLWKGPLGGVVTQLNEGVKPAT